ncbi:MAG: enoyl-[acyl-carrier-protein] reductase FabK [Candidatus Nealsonbacteria bacterium CG_4_10_14_0_2_um_filter_35_20]|nr:MAG: enoyl-[acyl-carrier-protein] reductase FabK [Candidatus Nealsonbacteria bacterium CG_4_10_14_0_2_um_filter_35_20]
MFKENKLTQLLGIKYPIIQGGMAGVSESKLVSAVSNAGGLGVIGSGFFPSSWLEEEIKKTKDSTDKPFGVNLFMRNPGVAELIKIIIEYQVPVVFTGGGNPLPVLPHLRAAGIKIIPVIALSRLAKKMEDSEADAVVAEGMESGGHIGKDSTLTLIPQSKALLKGIPLIAAGGIYDGKTAAAAFLLGADGVQLGTRFLASKECQIHENYKKKVLEATDEDITVVARFTGYPVRVINNEFAKKARKFEEKNPFPEEVKAENFAGSRASAGNVEEIPLLCGLCAGGIKEIKTCQEIIEEIMKGMDKIYE